MLIFFASLCLIWGFFVHTLAISFSRLGEIRSTDSLEKHPKRFFYSSIHKALFPSFDYLGLSCRISGAIALIAFGAFTLATLLPAAPLLSYFWTAVIAVAAVVIALVVTYLLPFLFASDKGVAFAVGIGSFFLLLSLPFTYSLSLFVRWIEKRKKTTKSHDELEEMKETIVEILQRRGVRGKLAASDKKLIEAIVRFKDRIVREVMVPRVDLFCLPVTMPIKEAAGLLAEEGYSRAPVYRETVDNVIGILMYRDLMSIYVDCERGKEEKVILDQPIETSIKRAFYVPETKKVSHLLQEFRTRQVHMAIVVDEYGGTEGVVTIEDLLEEIVGEISDEYDAEDEPLYIAAPGGAAWIVDARMSIFDAMEAFGIEIPQEGDYDTIGGYLFEHFNTIPQKGEKITHEAFEIEVISSTERSVEKVKLSKRKTDS